MSSENQMLEPKVSDGGRRPKTKIVSALHKHKEDAAKVYETAVLDEHERIERKRKVLKLLRDGFQGIEKAIANHPSYTEQDLQLFREEGFKV